MCGMARELMSQGIMCKLTMAGHIKFLWIFIKDSTVKLLPTNPLLNQNLIPSKTSSEVHQSSRSSCALCATSICVPVVALLLALLENANCSTNRKGEPTKSSRKPYECQLGEDASFCLFGSPVRMNEPM